MLQIRSWDDLVGGDYDWLQTKHHFPFNGMANPQHRPLGSLVVWNDDDIAPHSGFPTHGHRDMEIVTYVREGVLEHADNAGGRGQIPAGNVQVMSAGRGIAHSEANPGDEMLRIFQIWLMPRRRGLEPRWATKPFPKDARAGRFVPLASGYSEDTEALPIESNARVLGATLEAGQQIEHSLTGKRHAYLVATRGLITVNGQQVRPRDGVALSGEDLLTVTALEGAEIVLVETA